MDFPQSVIVTVTAEDIRLGRREKCFDCPIAIATGRALGHKDGVGVGISCDPYRIVILDKNRHLLESYRMPEIGLEFVGRFDEGVVIPPPFSMRIEKVAKK